MSETPEWLDEKGKIIEHKYCQCFLEQHPLLSKRSTGHAAADSKAASL